MKCIECGNDVVLIEKLIAKYDGLRVENVFLRNVSVEFCPSCEIETLAIRHMSQVHIAVGIGLALQSSKLTGEEIRFLRRLLRFSAAEWAARIGIAPETYSRWENGRSPAEQVEKLARIDFLFNVSEGFSFEGDLKTLASGLISVEIQDVRDFAIVVDAANPEKKPEYLNPLELAIRKPVVANITASTFWTPSLAEVQIKGEFDNASEPLAIAA